MVIGLYVRSADADRQQSRPGRVGVQLGIDVGGVHNPRQPHERSVASELVVLDLDLEGASAIAVGVPRARCVVADGVAAGRVQDLVGGDVQELRRWVNEFGDEPGARDPVGLGTGAGDPSRRAPFGNQYFATTVAQMQPRSRQGRIHVR